MKITVCDLCGVKLGTTYKVIELQEWKPSDICILTHIEACPDCYTNFTKHLDNFSKLKTP